MSKSYYPKSHVDPALVGRQTSYAMSSVMFNVLFDINSANNYFVLKIKKNKNFFLSFCYEADNFSSHDVIKCV